MTDSNAFAIGTTACWSGCLYEINPEIARIEATNDLRFEEYSNE